MSRLTCAVLALCLGPACGNSKPAPSEPASEATSGQPVQSDAAAEPGPSALVGTTDRFATSMGTLHLAPIWHGTVAFGIGDKVVVLDPWSKAPAGRIPKADLILLTDIHPDHLDPVALGMARTPETIVIGPPAVAAQVDGIVTLGNGEEREELGIRIRALPMYNEKRGPEAGKLYHDKGRGNGYLLGFGDTTVYISGDTECIPEMRALTDVDVALIAMNLPYTMPPEEAADCIKAFRPAVVIPFHYRGSDLEVLASELKDQEGIELRVRDFYKE